MCIHEGVPATLKKGSAPVSCGFYYFGGGGGGGRGSHASTLYIHLVILMQSVNHQVNVTTQYLHLGIVV